jgi:hypothetical protein
LDNTIAATTEAGEPLPCGAVGSTVWYRFGLSQDGRVQIRSDPSDYPTVLAIYTTPDESHMIACTADTQGPPGLDFFADGGIFYYLQVASADDAGGNMYLQIWEYPSGDVDCNERVDAVDALLALREVAKRSPPARCLYLGELDCDFELTSQDALMILRHVAGLTKSLAGCPP